MGHEVTSDLLVAFSFTGVHRHQEPSVGPAGALQEL